MVTMRTAQRTLLDTLALASPLMPVIFVLLMFIGILSPITWSQPGYFKVVIAVSIAISVVAAYCITRFMEDFRDS
jgi:membrane protein implicated in regulation of membrane protease activity